MSAAALVPASCACSVSQCRSLPCLLSHALWLLVTGGATVTAAILLAVCGTFFRPWCRSARLSPTVADTGTRYSYVHEQERSTQLLQGALVMDDLVF